MKKEKIITLIIAILFFAFGYTTARYQLTSEYVIGLKGSECLIGSRIYDGVYNIAILEKNPQFDDYWCEGTTCYYRIELFDGPYVGKTCEPCCMSKVNETHDMIVWLK